MVKWLVLYVQFVSLWNNVMGRVHSSAALIPELGVTQAGCLLSGALTWTTWEIRNPCQRLRGTLSPFFNLGSSVLLYRPWVRVLVNEVWTKMITYVNLMQDGSKRSPLSLDLTLMRWHSQNSAVTNEIQEHLDWLKMLHGCKHGCILCAFLIVILAI